MIWQIICKFFLKIRAASVGFTNRRNRAIQGSAIAPFGKSADFPNASGALPIPAAASKMIKSVYSATNGYEGYFNYMHYWAKNG